MRYRLRTLLIVLALGPVVLWAAWLTVCFIARGSKPNYPEATTTIQSRDIQYTAEPEWKLPEVDQR